MDQIISKQRTNSHFDMKVSDSSNIRLIFWFSGLWFLVLGSLVLGLGSLCLGVLWSSVL